MNLTHIAKVEKEISEFLVRAKDVRERAKDDEHCFFGCKETAALKRQSMELSESLIVLRKA